MILTRTVNLHGVVLTIDEDAYQLLKDYLTDIENRLPEDERKDVMDDVESRIAELLQSALFARHAESVSIEMIRDVRSRIGEPNDFGENRRPTFRSGSVNRQGIGRVLTIVLKVILIIIAIQLLVPFLGLLFGLLMGFFGLSIGGMALVPAFGFDLMGGSTGWTWLLCLSLLAAIAMPVYMIAYWIVKYSREHRHPSLRFWIICLLIWLLSFVGLGASAKRAIQVHNTSVPTLIKSLDQLDDLDDLDELDELNQY